MRKAFTIAGAQARELLRCSEGLPKSSIIQPVPRLFSTPRKSRVPHPSRSWLSEAWDSTRYPLTFPDLAGCDEGKAACFNASPNIPNPTPPLLNRERQIVPSFSHSAPKKHWTNSRRFFRFLNHFRNLRIPNYPCDWKPGREAFYAYVMAHWMAEHEILAAAIFVALSLALIAIFAALERHYKQPLTSRRKNYFS
jgi:hypothetical protein